MTKNDQHKLMALDAVRLLSNAIQMVHYFDHHDEAEGMSPACKDHGELMLQDALQYLAWGDTIGARDIMDVYDTWKATGEAPWPWDSSKPPPNSQLDDFKKGDHDPAKHDLFTNLEEDEGGGMRHKDEDNGDLDDDIPF